MSVLLRNFLIISFLLGSYILKAQDQIVVSVNPIEVKDLKKIKGDCDMYGHNPQISIEVTTSIEGESLVVSGWMKLKEDKADWTTFVQEFRYVQPIEQLRDLGFESFETSSGALRGEAGMHNHHYMTFEGQGLIQYAKILSDTPDLDCGKLGGTIHLRPVVINVSREL